MNPVITVTEPIWLYAGEAAWHFITIPTAYTDFVSSFAPAQRVGFGTIKVHVTLNDSSWNTSVFPDSKLHAYLLPIKKSIRQKHNLQVGDKPKLKIAFVDF